MVSDKEDQEIIFFTDLGKVTSSNMSKTVLRNQVPNQAFVIKVARRSVWRNKLTGDNFLGEQESSFMGLL